MAKKAAKKAKASSKRKTTKSAPKVAPVAVSVGIALNVKTNGNGNGPVRNFIALTTTAPYFGPLPKDNKVTCTSNPKWKVTSRMVVDSQCLLVSLNHAGNVKKGGYISPDSLDLNVTVTNSPGGNPDGSATISATLYDSEPAGP